MKPTCLLYVFLILTIRYVSAQNQTGIGAKWKTIQQLEAQATTHARDTSLVRTYADFVLELIKKEPVDSGLVYLGKAYQLAEHREWKAGILLVLIRKVSCLNIGNRHYEAIRIGLEGLKLAEKQNDVYYQGVFHRSLGNNYDMLDNYDRAIPHYETCLRLSEQVPALQLTRAHVLVELGDAYRLHKKRPDRAKAMIEQAIAIYQQKDTTALGYAYDYYGQALTDLALFREAEQSFARSAGYYHKTGNEYLIPELLLHEAELYVVAKQYGRAIAKAKECLTYSQQKKSLFGQRGAYRMLYESQKATGQMAQALANHEWFVKLNDSINEENNNHRFQAVRAKYELQTQADQIAKLTIEKQRQIQRFLLIGLVILIVLSSYIFYNNRQLRQKNRAINAALVRGQTIERQRVAADLHDNLGATLAALRWNLETMDNSKLSPVEQDVYATISQQIRQAYDDVRLLSHNLLPDELAKEGLPVALQKLIRKLNRNTSVRFRLNGTDMLPRMHMQTEFEVYSICLELLTNVCKHAQATEAYVTFSLNRETLSLTVCDNGTGFNGQRTEGHGLQNVAARVETVGGTWVVQSNGHGGMQHELVIPLTTPVHSAWQT